jgi:starch-binding outer membrane protein, SusD/RagB family
MKKLNYIIVLALTLVLGACAKLTEVPVGVFTPDAFFAKASDANAAINGAYALFGRYTDYGNDYFIACGTQDDQVKDAYSDTWFHDLFIFNSAEDKIGTVWTNIYAEIGAANNAISGIPRIADNLLSPEAKNTLIGEAKCIRAFDYFRLVRLYGAVPYISKVVLDPASVATIARMPTANIYDSITADLEASKDLLPNKYDAGTLIRSRVSKGTAYTILADVYLTRGNWTLAAQNAEYVITHKADFGYDLLPDYAQVFDFYDGNDNAEYIWSVDYSTIDGQTNQDQFAQLCGFGAWMGWGNPWGGWGTVYMSTAALKDFPAADYRRKITFIEDALAGGVNHHYNEFPQSSPVAAKTYRSYIGKPGVASDGKKGQNNASFTDANWPIYRYAEVLLIAAEAEARLGNVGQAETFVNQVRGRARNYDGVVGSSTVPADLVGGSAASIQDSVILERKRELCLEEKRWFDIKRLGLDLTVVYGPTGTDPLSPVPTNTKENLWWPIPILETNKNPNLLIDVQ